MKCGTFAAFILFSTGNALSITDEDRKLLCTAPYHKIHGDRKKIRWLHIPKTGTSFANVVWHYGCPNIPAGASIGNYDERFEGSLNDTYPIEKNCPYLINHSPSTHKPIGEKEWEENYGNFVAMFREPTDRIKSAFKMNKHCIQDCNPENNRMWECDAVRDIDRRNTTACDTVKAARCMAEYALAEPAQGCQTKMVYGVPCTADMRIDPSKRKLAAQRVAKGFAFVGLVEEWDLSVCLFHRTMGGLPFKVESDAVREGTPSSQPDECSQKVKHSLGDDKDPVDNVIYSAAKKVFEQQVTDALKEIKKQASLLSQGEEAEATISRHSDI